MSVDSNLQIHFEHRIFLLKNGKSDIIMVEEMLTALMKHEECKISLTDFQYILYYRQSHELEN